MGGVLEKSLQELQSQKFSSWGHGKIRNLITLHITSRYETMMFSCDLPVALSSNMSSVRETIKALALPVDSEAASSLGAVSEDRMRTSSSAGAWIVDAVVRTRPYQDSVLSGGVNVFPRSSILLSVDLIASKTAGFNEGWWRMSSSTADPIRTAFSLS